MGLRIVPVLRYVANFNFIFIIDDEGGIRIKKI